MNTKRRSIIIASFLAVLILFLILTLVGIENVTDALRTASPAIIALAIPIYLISWPLRGIRYQRILMQSGYKYDLNFLVGCIALSQSANVILPARMGDLIRAYLLKKMKKVQLTIALSSLAVERIFDILAIAMIGTLSLVCIRGLLIDRWITNVLAFAGLLLIVTFTLLILSLKIRTEIGGVVMGFVREIASVSTNPGAFLTILAGSLLVWLVDTITCFVILNAFSETIPYSMIPLVFLAIAVGNLTKIFPITPGAIGTYEGALTIIFSFGGINPAIGLVAAGIDHLVKNSVTLILGSAYLSHFGLSWTRLVEVAQE
ncbi:MAG: lysylphosphatidylglycerol synthase transmembrane domain-containing protein [Euryarchaeota archaeon]|nr:lysylphosphatidylglycerol synthase transmembrane domain-containing protein [Euryarchaeota archaeon]